MAELKRAIRITANSILRVAKDIPPVLTEDRLNDVMKCIRWWEVGKHANIHTLLQKSPELSEIFIKHKGNLLLQALKDLVWS